MQRNRKEKALSLYVHIPFCIRKCLYCDFLSGEAPEPVKEAYVKKLIEELEYRKAGIQGEYRLQTIFLGGGTPTSLSGDMLSRLGEEILSFPLAEHVEFTVEANPGTISKEILSALKELQVSRVSMGLQSADNRELLALGRIHTYEDFKRSYSFLRDAGFENINIDLMADIPGQTLESYQRTLERVCALEPAHISSYSLIVEEGTPFYQMQEKGILDLPDEETDRKMYAWTDSFLSEKGFFRYEISNYAKKGRECRHNLTYWKMGEYLGAGLGASSYFSGDRFRNETDLNTYLATPADHLVIETNKLSRKAEMEEFVFLGLRMMRGISVSEFRKRFAEDFYFVYGNVCMKFFHQGLLAESENRDRIYLTKRGIDVSNMVLAEFLLD